MSWRALDEPARVAMGWWWAAGVAVAMLGMRLATVDRGLWADLDVYVAGGRAVVDGLALDVVSAHGLPFTYPPFAAVCFAPLALMPVELVRVLVTAASVTALVAVVVVVARQLRLRALPVTVVLIMSLSIEPVARTLLLGQINVLLMMLVVVDLMVVPARWRGILLGLATGVKLVPGAFVLVLLVRRDRASCARWLVTVFATVVVGALPRLGDSVSFFSDGILDLGLGDEVMGVDNQSLAAVAMRATGVAPLPTAVSALLLLVVLGAGAWCADRIPAEEPGREVRQMMIIAIAALLASPVSWTHHWVWMTAVGLALVHGRHYMLGAITALVTWLGLVWLVDAEPAPAPHDLVGQVVGSAYVLLAVVIVIALARPARPRTATLPVRSSVSHAVSRNRLTPWVRTSTDPD